MHGGGNGGSTKLSIVKSKDRDEIHVSGIPNALFQVI